MHGKRCPVDGNTMRQVEFHGVRIDECPACEGTWFDRGELSIAMARLSTTPGYNPHGVLQSHGYVQDSSAHGGYRYDSSAHHAYQAHGHARPRKSFIEELFD